MPAGASYRGEAINPHNLSLYERIAGVASHAHDGPSGGNISDSDTGPDPNPSCSDAGMLGVRAISMEVRSGAQSLDLRRRDLDPSENSLHATN